MSDNFLYGAATSAHQVEGNSINNQWWAWEQHRLKQYRSGIACDHWDLYEKDFALAHQLGHTAHRISLEWSKVEPVEGKFSTSAIEHYRAVLLALKKYNMKTFVTLHHFTHPLWLEKQGGWENSQTPEKFAKYAKYCAEHLGDLVDYWITINEPMVYASQSYFKGIWPPQKKNIFSTVRVINNMARAHLLVYRILHRAYPAIPVGLASNMIACAKKDFLKDWLFNHLFFHRIKNTQDFIGVNYYYANSSDEPAPSRSDLGWIISPQGFTQVLLSLKKYKKPIFITENGIADASDTKRAEYIRSHLRAIEKAQALGCNVRGYLHWALIDNFEWAEGFSPRFGLIAVDYTTQKRTIRPSAFVYKAIIEQAKRVV